jgi:hypothetical protein
MKTNKRNFMKGLPLRVASFGLLGQVTDWNPGVEHENRELDATSSRG